MESVDTAEAQVVRRTTARRQIPERLNVVIATIILFVYLSLFLGAFLLVGRHFWLFGIVVIGFLVSTPTIWALVHEGIHGRLIRHPPANRAASRMLCILLGFSFDAVQFGHLMHHRYNGHKYDRPDRAVDTEPAWKSWARHWAHLLGGHYLITSLVSVVAFAPARVRQLALQTAMSSQDAEMVAMRHAAIKWFCNRERILRIRLDCVASILLALLFGSHYAAVWPPLVLVLWGRAFIYSVLDNLPHYGAQGRGEIAAKNLSLPRWASFLVLHHNLHRVHHERPDLPWRDVPAHFGETRTDGSYLLAAIRQFSGPSRT